MTTFRELEEAVQELVEERRPAVEEYQGRSRMEIRKLHRTIAASQRFWLTMPFDFFDSYGSAAAALVTAESYTNTQIAAISLTAFLDAQFGNTQGGVLFRGAAGWQFLSAGAPGDRLTSGGPGADVTWAP